MLTALASLLVAVWLAIALLHVYWAFGGRWASAAVIPTHPAGERVASPGPVPCLVVALGLCGCALLVSVKAGMVPLALPSWLVRGGVYAVAALFALRAVGDFNYVGFFKKPRETAFTRNDSRIFSPLCAALAAACLAVAVG